jgi:hypothetical protein
VGDAAREQTTPITAAVFPESNDLLRSFVSTFRGILGGNRFVEYVNERARTGACRGSLR